ncbi:ABC transporter ATP-binding protein [Effusibacillus consociatus]|uniref:ABC transporter ATP-binding protein n=1 Tax=Effusibacillus consociatus TaxID=1117041 RepID=A0ABV9Q229_9BACL
MSNFAVKTSHVTKSFRGETVLKDVSLEVHRGKIYGFVGHNGSGKSVFFKLLCGILVPDRGAIEIFGKKLGIDLDFPDQIGAVIEQPGFIPEFTGYKNLKYLASIRNLISQQQIKEAIRNVGLDPENQKSVKKYSLGMKQRLAIAQAIMEDPELLILDEPMNGLDKNGVQQIRNLILSLKEKGKTVLLSSHIMEDIQLLCDEVYEFENQTLIPIQVPEIVRNKIYR